MTTQPLTPGTVLKLTGSSYAKGTFNPKPGTLFVQVLESWKEEGSDAILAHVRETGRKTDRSGIVSLTIYAQADRGEAARLHWKRLCFRTVTDKVFFIANTVETYQAGNLAAFDPQKPARQATAREFMTKYHAARLYKGEVRPWRLFVWYAQQYAVNTNSPVPTRQDIYDAVKALPDLYLVTGDAGPAPEIVTL